MTAETNTCAGKAQGEFTLRARLFDEDTLRARLITALKDMPLALEAMEFAEEVHRSQRRKTLTGEIVPYINHPFTLACHALSLGIGSTDIICACLLHDALEDGVKPDGSPYTPEDLPASAAARDAVVRLSKNTYPDDPGHERYYKEICLSPAAMAVKCLDRCNNLSCMCAGFSREKLKQYVLETEAYILPMADRLEKYPEYASAAFAVKYHMLAVLEAVKRFL